MNLGPELFALLNAKQWVGKAKSPVVYGSQGIPLNEILQIEAQLGFSIPEDFSYFLQNIHDPTGVFFPWSNFNRLEYDKTINWVLRGIEFDIQNNKFWLPRWGNRPEELAEALNIARKDFQAWPRLLPIYGHRFLAAEPCLTGNPVFSIMQTDIIYYGANLAHYLLNEFVDQNYALHTHEREIRRIEVWSELAS